MGSLFSTPKAPPVTPPAPMPVPLINNNLLRQQKRRDVAAASTTGRDSTMLSQSGRTDYTTDKLGS